MLIDSDLLKLPILYPSYYFKKHHMEYYEKLDSVRTTGDFEGWIAYYLKAICSSAHDAHKRAKDIEKLEADLKNKIQTQTNFIKIRESAVLILEYLFKQPISSIGEISKNVGKAYNTVSNVLKHFIILDFVTVHDANKRGKVYRFTTYLNLLEKDYE